VLCYLTDDDIVAFLKRCGKALIAHGVIVLKENTCEGGEAFVLDKDDASVTRSLPYWLQLIEDSGLRVIQQEMQRNFPEELFPVPMLALEVNPDLHTTDPL
jgi:protein N-terminal methyltransferase